MNKKQIIGMQIAVILFNLLSFWIIGNSFGKLESFILSLLLYWVIMSGVLLWMPRKLGKINVGFNATSQVTKKSLIVSIAYIPAVGVFFAAFLPILDEFKFAFFLIAVAVGLMNGFLEEMFWRGLVLDTHMMLNKRMAIITTVLFALNHGAFLFLDFNYQGGALSLMGGPLVMGILWLFVARNVGTLKHGVIAHQMVNTLAFTSLFVENLF